MSDPQEKKNENVVNHKSNRPISLAHVIEMIVLGIILFLANYILLNDNTRLLLNFYQGYIWLLCSYKCELNQDHFVQTPTQITYSIQIISQVISITTTLNLQITTITIGLIYLLLSDNLQVTFISFEQVNISLYLLICTYSSGIKYIITSLIITTLFLFGILLTYTSITTYGWPLFLVFFLKQGVFPFHQLTADLYDGISTNLMMLVQLPIKLTIFLLMITKNIGQNLPIILSIAIIIPAITTQYAYTFKRFMSLSSASYQTLLVLFISSSTVANYSIVYILTQGLIMMSGPLIRTLLFLSVAGLPPFIGFYYKVYLVSEIQDLQEIWLLVIFLSSSLILTANYLERSSFAMEGKSSKMMSLLVGVVFFWGLC